MQPTTDTADLQSLIAGWECPRCGVPTTDQIFDSLGRRQASCAYCGSIFIMDRPHRPYLQIRDHVYGMLLAAGTVGIGGPREPNPTTILACRALVAMLRHKFVAVMTADSRGVDAEVRESYGRAAYVTKVTKEERQLRRAATAVRSARQIRDLEQRERPLWVAFAEVPCPAQIVPAKSWRSGKPASGTWSTTAMAIGHGIPALVFLRDVPVPKHGAWQLHPLQRLQPDLDWYVTESRSAAVDLQTRLALD